MVAFGQQKSGGILFWVVQTHYNSSWLLLGLLWTGHWERPQKTSTQPVGHHNGHRTNSSFQTWPQNPCLGKVPPNPKFVLVPRRHLKPRADKASCAWDLRFLVCRGPHQLNQTHCKLMSLLGSTPYYWLVYLHTKRNHNYERKKFEDSDSLVTTQEDTSSSQP